MHEFARIGRLSALACALLLAACVHDDPPLSADTNVVSVAKGDLPVPTREDLTYRGRVSLIGPFDRLSISVYNVPELDVRELQVDTNGKISVPLAGSVNASGRTAEELAEDIAAALRRRYVRDPRVAVNVLETRSQIFAVDGEVKEPGNYPLVGHVSLLEAIAAAKGPSDFAALQNVAVFRTVNNQRMAGVYDIRAIRNGTYADPEIYPNDVIVVGNSKSRRFSKDLLQILPALASPLVLLIR